MDWCPHCRAACSFERHPFHIRDRCTLLTRCASKLLVLDIPVCEAVRLSSTCAGCDLLLHWTTLANHTGELRHLGIERGRYGSVVDRFMAKTDAAPAHGVPCNFHYLDQSRILFPGALFHSTASRSRTVCRRGCCLHRKSAARFFSRPHFAGHCWSGFCDHSGGVHRYRARLPVLDARV